MRLVPDPPPSWQALTYIAWRDDQKALRLWQDQEATRPRPSGSLPALPDIFIEAVIAGASLRGIVIGGSRLDKGWDQSSEIVVFTDQNTIVRFIGASATTLTLFPFPQAFEEIPLVNDTRTSIGRQMDIWRMKTTMTFWFIGSEAARHRWQQHLDSRDISVNDVQDMPLPTQMVFLGEGFDRVLALVVGGRWSGLEEGFLLHYPLVLYTEHDRVIEVDPCEKLVRPVLVIPA